MSVLQLVIISIIQGITEWLPISSSGHVLLVSAYYGFIGQDELLINAMAHVGTLLAVLAYFRADILRAVKGGFELVGIARASKALSANGRLALLILASLPIALLVGVAFTQMPDVIKESLRSLWVVIGATVIFALALWWADTRPETKSSESEMSVPQAVLSVHRRPSPRSFPAPAAQALP